MSDRTPLGYCVDCPMAAHLAMHVDTYIADEQPGDHEPIATKVDIVDLDEADREELAEALAMTMHDAIRLGVSPDSVNELKAIVSECYTQLGDCAIRSDCQGPLAYADGNSCRAVGGKAVYETMQAAFEKHVMGWEG